MSVSGFRGVLARLTTASEPRATTKSVARRLHSQVRHRFRGARTLLGVGSEYVNDSAQISAAEAFRRNVTREHDDIEGAWRHRSSPGYAVTSRGTSSATPMNQTLTTIAACPFGPLRIARIV